MSTYVIGDIQGCYKTLLTLLEKINFHSEKDTLWFTGDLVNRGPNSLETLRFVKQLKLCHLVLGNHDLHLLAVAFGSHSLSEEDTLTSILEAPDKDELLNWLCRQPLLHHDEKFNMTMVHAGLAYNWDLNTAKNLAKEVEMILQSEEKSAFFQYMYGDQPDHWDRELKGNDRLRVITNYLTRARFCYPDGRLELRNKGKIENTESESLIPWFRVKDRKTQQNKIIFGHWAALGGITNTPNTYALDTGCIWGFSLTAMRLEDEKRFSVSCDVK